MEVKTYLQPQSLAGLSDALLQMEEGSKILAGGTDLIIRIRNREGTIPLLLSVCRVRELYGIFGEADGLVIGAMENFASIASDSRVRNEPYLEALGMACARVGSRQIRNKGTIGGNLGNASVAGDMIPVLTMYHAEAEIMRGGGALRRLPVEALITGVSRTALRPDEIITRIRIPMRPGRRSCFLKLGGREAVTVAELSLCMTWRTEKGVFAGVEGVLGAVDAHPVVLDEAAEIVDGTAGGGQVWGRLADSLSGRISAIRMKRTRPPKLRIREGEKAYKERAVRGIVFDLGGRMEASLHESERG
ncbi:FAD binding domain-containing protein [Chordicoccus furentiruminis]|uniref:FAD binding domain-containing protein n=1 Tax=Chordicoccus furentiruminis TaxID=2709410 RepID=UPI0023A807FB|nr:FAD binding domain-containing protein [Chordicoccus furentiruminis]